MVTYLLQQQGMCLMPIVQKNLHTKDRLNMTKQDKIVIVVSLWLPW